MSTTDDILRDLRMSTRVIGIQLETIKELEARIAALEGDAHAEFNMAVPLMDEAAAILEALSPDVLEKLPNWRWPLADELSGAAGILRDRLARPQWLPIETAPRDGTEILLLVPHRLRAGQMLRLTGRWFPSGGAWITFNADGAIQRVEPTSWQPLPALPEA